MKKILISLTEEQVEALHLYKERSKMFSTRSAIIRFAIDKALPSEDFDKARATVMERRIAELRKEDCNEQATD